MSSQQIVVYKLYTENYIDVYQNLHLLTNTKRGSFGMFEPKINYVIEILNLTLC